MYTVGLERFSLLELKGSIMTTTKLGFSKAKNFFVLLIGAQLPLMFSCEDKFLKQATADKTAAISTLQTTLDDSGNHVASFDPTKSETQLMRITSGAIAGAAVAIPPAALSIPVAVTVGEGVSLASTSFSNTLGLSDNKLAAGGPSVSFTASQDVVASNPMTLSIPFGSLSFALAEIDTENLVVMYRWTTIENGEAKFEAGVLPGDSVTRGRNKVSFQTTRFGTFQVGLAERKITANLTAKSEEPPALKSCERYAAAVFPNCTKDGQVGCVTTDGFKAADMSLAKSEFILSGQKIADVAGNVTLPAAGKVLAPVTYGAAGTAVTGTATLPLPENVLAGSPNYGDPGSSVLPSLVNQGTWNLTTSFPGAGYYSAVSNWPTDASIAGGTTLLGLDIPAAPEFCSADGQTGCKVVGPSFAAALTSNISSDKILAPTTIAGVQGNVRLPSPADVKFDVSFGANNSLDGELIPTTTFPTCSNDNQTGCVADTDYPSVNRSYISENADEFASSLTIAGVQGLLNSCYNGGSGCYLPPYETGHQQLKALLDTDSTTNPWDIRIGKSVNGILGELKTTCRNRPQLQTVSGSVVNYSPVQINLPSNHGITAGSQIIVNFSGSIPNLPNGTYHAQSVYTNSLNLAYITSPSTQISVSATMPSPSPTATINASSGTTTNTTDDFNFAALMPWSSVTDCGGVDLPTITNDNNNVWLDVTTTDGNTPSTCASSATNCTLQDKITGLWWSKSQTLDQPWDDARTTCASLDYNGKNDWRLPTQKELMEAYAHGIRSVPSSLGSTNNWISESIVSSNYFWSSSSTSWTSTNAWKVHLAKGAVTENAKTSSLAIVCVR